MALRAVHNDTGTTPAKDHAHWTRLKSLKLSEHFGAEEGPSRAGTSPTRHVSPACPQLTRLTLGGRRRETKPCTPLGTRLYSQSYHTMIAVRAVTLRAARRDAPPRQRRDGRGKSLAKGALRRVAEPARKLAHVSRQHLRVHSHIAELRLSQLGEVQEVVVAEVLWRTAYVLTNTQHKRTDASPPLGPPAFARIAAGQAVRAPMRQERRMDTQRRGGAPPLLARTAVTSDAPPTPALGAGASVCTTSCWLPLWPAWLAWLPPWHWPPGLAATLPRWLPPQQ